MTCDEGFASLSIRAAETMSMLDTGGGAPGQADVLMMSIETPIPDHFHVYQVGFDASPSAVPVAAVGIHQPDGSYKSISTAASISTSFPKPDFPPTEVQPTDQTHFQVQTLQTLQRDPGSSAQLSEGSSRGASFQALKVLGARWRRCCGGRAPRWGGPRGPP